MVLSLILAVVKLSMQCTTYLELQDSSTGRASDLGSKGPEFNSRMVHFQILIIFCIYLVLYEFDMKSFKLIRNINYDVINYIFNVICIFNHRCYCS